MCVSLPARIVEIEPGERSALVAVGGRERRVSLDLLVVQDIAVGPGEWILVNAGAAVERLDDEAAAELLELLKEGEPT